MVINLSKPVPSVSAILGLKGIEEMNCRLVRTVFAEHSAKDVIDQCFSIRLKDDSPEMFIHVMSGTRTSLGSLGLPTEQGKGKHMVVFPPSVIMDPKLLLEENLQMAQPVNQPTKHVALQYLPWYENQPIEENPIDRLTDRVVQELLKLPSLYKLKVAMLDSTRGEKLFRYLVDVRVRQTSYRNIWIDQYLRDGKPYFELRGPISANVGYIATLIRLVDSSIIMVRRDCKEIENEY